MPPTPKRAVVTAPPAKETTHRANISRVKQLKTKGNGRSAAESNELIDILLALLPPNVLS